MSKGLTAIPRRFFQACSILLFLLMFLLLFFYISERRNKAFNDPKGKIETVADYLRQMGNPQRIFSAVKDGEAYVLVYGERKGRASGPPAYLFTTDGFLFDWCPDIGDTPFIHGRFYLDHVQIIEEIPLTSITRK
ncbi:MAG: hypothetical protein KKE17_10610 [Proteobacteria bacterium]|nr:hypothetical protein [Pseudomonadota bacterium]MBU1710443.1 hypothetical protein [Pseudomonadota bacterium]